MTPRILITGASGLLGGNCLDYFQEKNIEVKGTHFSCPTPRTFFYNTIEPHALDNKDILDFRPTHILHTGALTHVDRCEVEPEESYLQTVISAKNMLLLAQKCNAQLIYSSTDYVFDGRDGPYSEEDAVNPLSVYGKHKRQVEEMILDDSDRHLIIRITNVYGEEIRRKNFVARLAEKADSGEPVELRLPLDQFATPACAYDVARALYCLVTDGKKGIYHLASTDYISRMQLAMKVISYYPTNKVSLIPLFTANMDQPARRPLRGGLRTEKFHYEYPDFYFHSVDEYLRAALQ
ncbi:MAG: SDR family oxidoreductase [Bacteroidota bacterium]|nr:SDR family oxidoreductase [Bacteroidota bacterium]